MARKRSKENRMTMAITRLSLLLGVGALLTWMYLDFTAETDCHKFHHRNNPLLRYPLLLLSLSFLKFIACYSFPIIKTNKSVIYSYSVAMFMLILMIISSTKYVLFSITNADDGTNSVGRAYKQYTINYSIDMWRYAPSVADMKTRTCLRQSKPCTEFAAQVRNLNASQIDNTKWSPIQSSCCMPPNHCGYHYVNASLYTYSKAEMEALQRRRIGIVDCFLWHNNEQWFCYQCNSCDAAIFAIINKELRLFAKTNIWTIFLFLIYCFIANTTHFRPPPTNILVY